MKLTEEETQILDKAHEIETLRRSPLYRKELNTMLPDSMSYDDKRKVIRAWQNAYFSRLSHIMDYRLNPMRHSDVSLGV